MRRSRKPMVFTLKHMTGRERRLGLSVRKDGYDESHEYDHEDSVR